ncbi:MAG TPA: efflux transporter outer membrane subunit [Bryobacteraceae bacterium]|jgi:multidrug efflux system outer membrane protein|nr:efflux transporter outer membrane subunit [Bryobacteraceae bacterium]
MMGEIARGSKISAAALAILLSGCTMGPDYKRPPVNVPESYRHQAETQSAASLGDEKWAEIYRDPELQKLIRTALAQNYDVRIAASRILQAQAQVGLARSQSWPQIGSSISYGGEKLGPFAFTFFQLLGSFSWDPDFWGKYRRATEAARAQMLAAEWNRRGVLLAVVSNVAGAYFQLRELDLELDIARQTLASRRESLQLTETLSNGGAASLLDVRQAEQLVETAAETIPATEQQIAIEEDLLSTLTGENPHPIPRGRAITEEPLPAAVPAGLPSRLLERRPDILAAEQQLVAANAQIGVARAAFFPDLPLTGAFGGESPQLSGLFTHAGWNFSVPLNQPIFTAGRLRSNLKLVEAQREQAVLAYQQTIQQAFRQVSDALISYTKLREFRERQQALTTAAQSAADLSQIRYKGGAASYLEVLTNETNHFAAQLNLARAELNERLSLVQLYAALGGGWEQ